MKKERIIISFIAVIVGLFVTGVSFYIYQATKTIPASKTKLISPPSSPTPSIKSSFFLTVDSPKDEDVVDTKTITIAGKTNPDSIIIVSTDVSDQVVTPAKNGNFSVTQGIGDGPNQLEITSIAPNGEEVKMIRTITFSTESF